MSTTGEIMDLAEDYADWAADKSKAHPATSEARATLLTAIDELVKQTTWAHHTPALLSEADAAADLAGVARPGAEPYAYAVHFPYEPREELVHDLDDLLDDLTSCTHSITPLYTAPPQASQPEQQDYRAMYLKVRDELAEAQQRLDVCEALARSVMNDQTGRA